MKKEKGSITIFFIIITAVFVLLLAIIAQYSYFRFIYSKTKSDIYLEMDNQMSYFNKEIFNEMGLLGVKSKKNEFKNSLDNNIILEKSIVEIMKHKYLIGAVSKTEDIINEFLSAKIDIPNTLFDIGELNNELRSILEGKYSNIEISSFISKLTTARAYLNLSGMSMSKLISHLKNLDFNKIKEANVYFTIKPSIADSFYKLHEAALKYDITNLYKHYTISDYIVEYLGYSITKEESKRYTAEYILTGTNNKSVQKLVISAELYLLRLLLNFGETLYNPNVRKTISRFSFGIPYLYLLEALLISSAESAMDIRALFKRKLIPIYKGRESFAIFRGGFKRYKKGFSYPDYLKLLLTFMPKESVLGGLKTSIEKNYNINLKDYFTRLEYSKKLEIKGRFISFNFKRDIEAYLDFLEKEEE